MTGESVRDRAITVARNDYHVANLGNLWLTLNEFDQFVAAVVDAVLPVINDDKAQQ